MKKFNEIREENEKLQAAKPSEPETAETEKKWGSQSSG